MEEPPIGASRSGTQDQEPAAPTGILWTPWRMTYVGGSAPSGCVFCHHRDAGEDVENLVIHRGEHTFMIMNLYPYNTGHLMMVPNLHTAELAELSPEPLIEMVELLPLLTTIIRSALRCDGFNIGFNLGAAAGAGIADHLHQHIVPRWVGDTNFMPLVGNAKVLPELLPATYAKLRLEVASHLFNIDRIFLRVTNPDGQHLRRTAPDASLHLEIPVSGETPIWRQISDHLQHLGLNAEFDRWLAPIRAAEPGTPLIQLQTTSTDLPNGYQWVKLSE